MKGYQHGRGGIIKTLSGGYRFPCFKNNKRRRRGRQDQHQNRKKMPAAAVPQAEKHPHRQRDNKEIKRGPIQNPAGGLEKQQTQEANRKGTARKKQTKQLAHNGLRRV